MENKRRTFDVMTIILVVVMLAGFVLMHDIVSIPGEEQGTNSGSSLFGRSSWNSYTIQAMAWLDGRTYLCDIDDDTYNYLELAEYDGKKYVSFPPTPSVLILPAVFIFGEETPDNLIMALICIATVLIAYSMLKRGGMKENVSALIALFYVFGSNMCAMSINGGVWFMAQAFNMLLLTIAIDCMMKNRRTASYICAALAVGCRPFSALMFFVLFFVYFQRDRHDGSERSIGKCIVEQLPTLIGAAVIAVCYMVYNAIRFDNILEFGHNYLPEFTESPNGQFSLTYLLSNLRNYFLEPIQIDSNLHIDFPWFNGFMFYIANPIFLMVIVRMVINILKKRWCAERIIVLGAIAMNIILLCCHKTLGGWQFGARYTVDMVPLALLYMLMSAKKTENDGVLVRTQVYRGFIRPTMYEYAFVAWGIMFNVYGTAAFWIRHYMR